MGSSIRNRLIMICIFLLVVAACARPTEISHSDLVATIVAGTLTGLPPLPPSATPDSGPPSEISSATPSSEPSATATQTPTPTQTATASPTPGPEDPRIGLDLDNPDHRDEFTTPGRWYNGYDGPDASLNFEGPTFAAIDKTTDYFVTYSASVRTEVNFYVEIDATIQICSGRDASGFAFRVGGASYDQAYIFEVACNGSYRLQKFISITSDPELLINWTPSLVINKGPNATNRLGVFADGDELYLFVNDALLREFPVVDNAYSEGRFGLFANAISTPNLKVVFDNFELWILAP
ncbi:MAG TPA: hypothetical protein G4O08_10120 [Anaerolineae bacterium]|nr:hypothetical protein [Anaerolineae bacterium]